MHAEQLFALVFTIGMFAGVFIIFLGMRQRSHQLEMIHRERMAMIERGQVPPGPVVGNPLSSSSYAPGLRSRAGSSGTRSMTLGVVIVAVGLGLMTVISIAGEAPQAGLGIGGAIAIIGIAFLVIGMINRNTQDESQGLHSPPPPPQFPPRDSA